MSAIARGGALLLEAPGDGPRVEGDRVIDTSWNAHDYQRGILAHDTGIDFFIGGIGVGKSQPGAQKMTWWTLRHPLRHDGEPCRGLIMGKDARNAEKNQFRKIVQQVKKLGIPPRYVIRSIVGGKEPAITFWNGVVLEAFSGGAHASEDAARSSECDFAWFDEGEHLNPTSFGVGLGRLRAAHEGQMRAVVTSNPGGGAWIYPLLSGEAEEWRGFVEANEVRIFRAASEVNPSLSREQLRRLRATAEAISPGSSRQDFDGRYLGTAEAPGTGPIEYARAFAAEKLELDEARARVAVVAADLGKSKDFCWFVAMTAGGVVVAQERFNLDRFEGPSPDYYWPWVREQLASFAAAWRTPLIVVDAAKGGDVFTGSLRETVGHVRVLDYKTDTVGKKSSAVEAAGKAIELGKIRVPRVVAIKGKLPLTVKHVDDLRREFKKLQVIEKGGKRSFHAGENAHDDGIVALALAWYGLGKGPGAPVDYSSWDPPETPRGRFS